MDRVMDARGRQFIIECIAMAKEEEDGWVWNFSKISNDYELWQ